MTDDRNVTSEAGAHQCLTGYTILDLTQYLAGPFCTLILAALGATVIKVEPIGSGDGNRHQPPFVTADGFRSEPLPTEEEVGLAFLKRNPGKLSLALDLKKKRGQELLKSLVRVSDACVHNFRPGVAERLGVDAATLQSINEKLVYCEISGLGSYAPRGDDRGVVDIVVQALSGMMAFTGQTDGEPTRSAAPIGDQIGGLFAAISILAGLLERDGKAKRSHASSFMVPMLSALSSVVWDEHHDLYYKEGQPERRGSSTQRIVPWNVFKAKDGYLVIAAVSPQEWERLVDATEIHEFRAEAGWRILSNRVTDRDKIESLLSAWTSSLSRDQAVTRLLQFGVTTAPVYGIRDILADERLQDTMLSKVAHPIHGPTEALQSRFPIIVNDVQIKSYDRPAPLLGMDSQYVLEHFAGLSPEEIRSLKDDGAVSLSGDSRRASVSS